MFWYDDIKVRFTEMLHVYLMCHIIISKKRVCMCQFVKFKNYYHPSQFLFLFLPVLTVLSSNFPFTLHSSSDVFSIRDYLLNVDHYRSNNDVARQPSKFSSPGSASTSRLPCFFCLYWCKELT